MKVDLSPLQLRDCLDADVYELFHKKLTEHALMKDPKFLWCCHVSAPPSALGSPSYSSARGGLFPVG